MGVWSTVGGIAGGAIGFVGSGFNPMGAVGGYALGAGVGGMVDSAVASDDAIDGAKARGFNGAPQVNPNTGIGQGSFGLTPQEQAAQGQFDAQYGAMVPELEKQSQAVQAELQEYNAKFRAANTTASEIWPSLLGVMKRRHA